MYKITGNTISSIENGIVCITINNPLAKSIYRKKLNDTFQYEIDSNIVSGKIVEIK